MKQSHFLTLMLLVFSLFAGAQQFKLKAPEFAIGSDGAKLMADMVPMMTQQLRTDLAQRPDIEIVDDGASASKCQCLIKDFQVAKNVFAGTEYTAWHARVTALVQVQVEINGNKVSRQFSITRRLRSTIGEPQLDNATLKGMARDIARQCYGELVDILECN